MALIKSLAKTGLSVFSIILLESMVFPIIYLCVQHCWLFKDFLTGSRYLTRTTSERTQQPISNALKVTQSDQTLAKPDFVLQDSHISSSCDLSSKSHTQHTQCDLSSKSHTQHTQCDLSSKSHTQHTHSVISAVSHIRSTHCVISAVSHIRSTVWSQQ